MKVIFESKYTFLFFLFFIFYARARITHNSGKEAVYMHSPKLGNAQEDVVLHWPKGIVTYYLDNLAYDYYIAQMVRMSMNVLESASCVLFKPALIKPAGNMTWIHFTNPQGERNCVHKPKFKKDGEIVLVLGYDCLKERDILHTLLHAIGFEDEVSHPNRDHYIRVMWNNIRPEYRHLYRVRPSDDVSSQKLVEYDPMSIMHFHDRAFSLNGHATLMTLVPGLLISPSDDLSQLDKMKLRLLFDHECNKRKVGDIINTCKMALSHKTRPNDAINETDVKSDEKHGYSNKINEATQIDKEEENHKVEKSDEVQGQQKELSIIENQYDLNEFQPDSEIREMKLGKKNKTVDSVSSRDYEGEKISEYENEA